MDVGQTRLAVPMIAQLRDVTGFRGEKIVELCLTEYEGLAYPCSDPGSWATSGPRSTSTSN